VLIAWLFVGRVLLHRIDMLSQWMRQMAGGDLEARAEIRGRDEVAEMAAALEVFRQHAIEIQRLNLVEELADELQGKNGELEQALTDLNTAQGQIVMREKLAALGELTAGVAHEIRNPLNFVKNFSEVSEELLEELKETLEESDDGRLNEEQQDLIEDIFGELGGNLERIRNHGDRANRIVQDMLMMSRESVGHHPTNINNLLDEHARLAYHSARAMDSNFQLDLQYDFDESMGEIVVNPQDLGRVFLNIVNNGCYATNEKRTTLTQGGSDYSPTLWLSTRRDDDRIHISMRDNGTGMPPEVIEKMFNPFFTTKPTDKGTGLGLSICNDIIRRHGGEILVESEPGEFTEMTIALPLHPPEPVADEPEDEVEQELVADAAEVGND
jgi:signal transduction histidine kinase